MTVKTLRILAWIFEFCVLAAAVWFAYQISPIAMRLLEGSSGQEWWLGMIFFMAAAIFVFRKLTVSVITAGMFVGGFYGGWFGVPFPSLMMKAEKDFQDQRRFSEDYGY